VGTPYKDNYQNYISSLCSLLNSVAVILVTLPTFVPLELLPSWIEGPIVMFLLTAATGLQLALSLLNPIKDFLVVLCSVGAQLASRLQICGAMKIIEPITSVFLALSAALKTRFSKLFMARAKTRAANALLEEDADLDQVNSNVYCFIFLTVYPKCMPCGN